jgi:hypothetical protein
MHTIFVWIKATIIDKPLSHSVIASICEVRGNPTQSLRGLSPCLHDEVVIYPETFLPSGRFGTLAWQFQEFPRRTISKLVFGAKYSRSFQK